MEGAGQHSRREGDGFSRGRCDEQGYAVSKVSH